MNIGAISQSLGLTLRAIRFYEEVGLVAAGRDRLGWRRFDRDARIRLQVIAWLREADAPLEEVSSILALDDAEARRERIGAVLRARRATLAAELDRLDEVVAHLPCAELG